MQYVIFGKVKDHQNRQLAYILSIFVEIFFDINFNVLGGTWNFYSFFRHKSNFYLISNAARGISKYN